jgi:catechol 2,3-dioxygenase
MRLAAPTLRVRNLEDTLAFYERDIGLHLNRRGHDSEGFEVLELGFEQNKDPLLVIKHDPDARRPPHDFAGLYHYAALLPDRKGLASTFLAVGKTGVSYEGFADHSFSEALYLHDVEMNGMEFYADRPRSTWPDWKLVRGTGGFMRFAALNKPLDLDSLVGELDREERASPISFPRGARIGHMHLRVTNLERSVNFYHERLGLDVMAHMPEMGAAFLSVGGYHHHLGLNTWHSQGGSSHSRGDAGLEEFRMVLPDEAALNEVAARFPGSPEDNGVISITDPDGIMISISS